MSEPPPYTKYRARPRLRRAADDDALPPVGAVDDRGPDAPRRRRRLQVGRLTPRRVLGYLATFVVGWLVLSLLVFLVSAFVHRSDVGGQLGSAGFPLTSPNTVLVLGSDGRTKGSKEPGAATNGARSDSIILMRVGGGASARLSIPRDTVVDIPGHGRQKINAAYAYGGAALAAQTIDAFLGVRIDHVVEVNFANFPKLIDAMGGVDYTGGCVVSRINGGFANGGYTLRLGAGRTRIDGAQALALARTRKNACNPRESDLTRARRQQKLFSAMKSRLLSPGAFARLPVISWQAPQALRSDMGGPTLLGVFGAIATSGTPATRVLRPTGQETLPDGGAGLTVSAAEVAAEAARLKSG